MSLDKNEVTTLEKSIQDYSFPAVYFDFYKGSQVKADDITEVEAIIRTQLISRNPDDAVYGLANVIYWGYAQIPYRDFRVKRFLENVNKEHASAFQKLVSNKNIPSLRQLRDLKMPEFSGISFISKILAFLAPDKRCVLDKQLAYIATGDTTGALNRLNQGQQIAVTRHNETVYNDWCKECLSISAKYFNNKYRAIDIERGFFNLVQNNKLQIAQAIYIKTVSC